MLATTLPSKPPSPTDPYIQSSSTSLLQLQVDRYTNPRVQKLQKTCKTKGAFGSAGCRVVIEKFLEGEEASFFALVDGENAISLESAQDNKRVGDGDTGSNTGGMGAYILPSTHIDRRAQIFGYEFYNHSNWERNVCRRM